MHTLLDLKGSIPVFIQISAANVHDVNILDNIHLEPGPIVVMDRGYLDFARLYRLNQQAVFFVTRTKKNTRYRRVYSHLTPTSGHVYCDQSIRLTGVVSSKSYPDYLRRIRYKSPDTGKRLDFLTNNTSLPAQTIADIYKHRWKVELFFKWIKQHLQIETFFGNSENAVRTQIWIAISVYLLVAIAKKRLGISASLYTMLQVLSVSIFDKTPIIQLFPDSDYNMISDDEPNHLSLLELKSGQ